MRAGRLRIEVLDIKGLLNPTPSLLRVNDGKRGKKDRPRKSGSENKKTGELTRIIPDRGNPERELPS